MHPIVQKTFQNVEEEHLSPLREVGFFEAFVSEATFLECMHLASLLTNRYPRMDGAGDCLVDLLEWTKRGHSKEWSFDWKNDAYFATMMHLMTCENEAFALVQHLVGTFEDPPQSLILLYLFLSGSPDISISEDEKNRMILLANRKDVTHESARWMVRYYDAIGDHEKLTEWQALSKELKADGIHAKVIVPQSMQPYLNGDPHFRYEDA